MFIVCALCAQRGHDSAMEVDLDMHHDLIDESHKAVAGRHAATTKHQFTTNPR